MTSGERPGELLLAGAFEFPATATMRTPLFQAAVMAASHVVEADPPSEILMTPVFVRPLETMSLTAQLKPAKTSDALPLAPSRTFTATIVVFLATPYFAPPTVPATCLEWVRWRKCMCWERLLTFRGRHCLR